MLKKNKTNTVLENNITNLSSGVTSPGSFFRKNAIGVPCKVLFPSDVSSTKSTLSTATKTRRPGNIYGG